MNGPYLASGTLSEFQPLGADGDTLFSAARELRAAIARRLGTDVAASFAIPQQNADGDALDWYASEPGPVHRWGDLADERRQQVTVQIEKLQEQIRTLSHSLAKEEAVALRTFGHLLEHATTIPDRSHIFLVGDCPVLTFWGFRSRGSDSSVLPRREWPIQAIEKAPHVAHSGGSLPMKGTRAKSESSNPGTAPPGIEIPFLWNTNIRWWLTGIGIALLILILLWLWVHKGLTELSPEPLVIPLKAIESGSMDFLTGRWQATSNTLVDSATKRPLVIAYDLDGGEGEILVTEQDDRICRSPVDATFDGDALVLRPRTAIRCPNKDPFYGTTLTCRPRTDGRTECIGRFPDGKQFRVDMRKQRL